MPGFLDNLLGVIGLDKNNYITTPPYQGSLKKIRDVNSSMPNGLSYLANVARARGSGEFGQGPVAEEVTSNLTNPTDLGLADRYSTGRLYAEEGRSPLSFIPYVGYEGMKAAAQNPITGPTAKPLLSLAGKVYNKLSGSSLKDNEYNLDDTSSPASLDNLRSLWQGYSDENEKNPKEGFLSSLVNFE